MPQFEPPVTVSDPHPVVLATRALMTLAEARAYARVSPAELLMAVQDGRVRRALVDPLDAAGTLVARQDVDAWWRQRVLDRS
jgi:hypothetical protein